MELHVLRNKVREKCEAYYTPEPLQLIEDTALREYLAEISIHEIEEVLYKKFNYELKSLSDKLTLLTDELERLDLKEKIKNFIESTINNYASDKFKNLFKDGTITFEEQKKRAKKAVEIDPRTVRKFLNGKSIPSEKTLDFFSVFIGISGWNKFKYVLNSEKATLNGNSLMIPTIEKNQLKYNQILIINKHIEDVKEGCFSMAEMFHTDKKQNWKSLLYDVKKKIYTSNLYSSIDDTFYFINLENVSLSKLLEEMPIIENRIVEEIYVFSLDFLKKEGFEPIGDLFTYKGGKYRLIIQFEKSTRVLNICITHIDSSDKTINHEVSIHQIGSVKQIKFIFSGRLKNNFIGYMDVVSKIFIHSYLYIEKKFISEYKNTRELLFENLYTILNTEMEFQNKKNLFGEGFFVVTTRQNTRFRYFFETDHLRTVISKFKNNQTHQFSPFELVSNLLIQEAIHTINLLIDIEIDKTVFLDSIHFKSVEEDYCFWTAESSLIDFKEISTYTIYSNEKYIFQMSFKREFEIEFEKILKSCRKSLENQFVSNIDNYYIYAKSLMEIQRDTLLNGEKQLKLSEFIDTVLNY